MIDFEEIITHNIWDHLPLSERNFGWLLFQSICVKLLWCNLLLRVQSTDHSSFILDTDYINIGLYTIWGNFWDPIENQFIKQNNCGIKHLIKRQILVADLLKVVAVSDLRRLSYTTTLLEPKNSLFKITTSQWMLLNMKLVIIFTSL